MLAIVAGMEHELVRLRPFLTRQDGASWDRPDLHVIGIGKANSQRNIRAVLDRHSPDRESGSVDGLLLLGFAGAVDPSLETGRLALPSQFHLDIDPPTESRSASSLMLDLGLRCASALGMEASQDGSLTVDRLIAASPEKLELANRYPVTSVNMEDYWVAEAAAEARVPFLSARVILDVAEQDLPGYLSTFSHSRGRAVLGALSRPWRVPTLIRIARQMRQCQRVLTRFAVSYLDLWDRNTTAGRGPEIAGAVR